MLRKKLAQSNRKAVKAIPWRCREVLRIEAFSDAVFAFAITLLIVSLEVPENFSQLKSTMMGFPAFAISFAILFQVWYEQFHFFRRFGLEDTFTIVMNAFLIFVVLFYVYPLKFLFRLLFRPDEGPGAPQMLKQAELPELMIFYAIGMLLIYFIFYLLYRHASAKNEENGFSSKEAYSIQIVKNSFLINVLIPVSTIVFCLIADPKNAGFSGFLYFLIGLAYYFCYRVMEKKLRTRFIGE